MPLSCPPSSFLRAAAVAAAAMACAAPHAATATSAATSAIRQVTLFPGGATVERLVRVAAGSAPRQIEIDCLPMTLDAGSLQMQLNQAVQPEGSARALDLRVRTVPRKLRPACDATAASARVRALEERLADLGVESDANDLALALLKSRVKPVAADEDADAAPAARAPRSTPPPGVAADQMRRAGLDVFRRAREIARERAAIEAELAPLRADADRLKGRDEHVRVVTALVHAPQGGEFMLSYRVAGAGWAPAYRATLDSATAAVRLERQAVVHQASGEDWSGVAMRLVTTAPQATGAPPVPAPWWANCGSATLRRPPRRHPCASSRRKPSNRRKSPPTMNPKRRPSSTPRSPPSSRCRAASIWRATARAAH
jgi:uncharacterized protein (TIGR02231 family)